MKELTIGFIGGGNMARSLIGGLMADGAPPQAIFVSDPNAEQRALFATQPGVNALESNAAVVNASDLLVLAVKPQVLAGVCRGIASEVQARRPLIVSIAAGVRSADIERWLGGNLPVVRTMPNTPALVQCGATAMAANSRVSKGQREMAEGLMRAVGLTLWVDDEGQMDAVTALSGSGPAYLFLVIEAMEKAGVALGLPQPVARLLTLQTAFGAAKMALESAEDAALLRRRVTSPGGTTERAIACFEEGDLQGLFTEALTAARNRSRELAEILGGDAQ